MKYILVGLLLLNPLIAQAKSFKARLEGAHNAKCVSEFVSLLDTLESENTILQKENRRLKAIQYAYEEKIKLACSTRSVHLTICDLYGKPELIK